jgi:predicted nucleotidyltransferase
MQVTIIKKSIVPVLKKYHVTQAGIFGSLVTGNFTKTSDIDILVKIPAKYDLGHIFELKIALEKKVGRPIDLVEYRLLKPTIKKAVLKQEVRII